MRNGFMVEGEPKVDLWATGGEVCKVDDYISLRWIIAAEIDLADKWNKQLFFSN